MFTLVLANSSGIPSALERIERDEGIKPIKYIRRAIARSLVEDGYLESEPPDDLRFGPRLDKKRRK